VVGVVGYVDSSYHGHVQIGKLQADEQHPGSHIKVGVVGSIGDIVGPVVGGVVAVGVG